jgi:hypothetical protein
MPHRNVSNHLWEGRVNSEHAESPVEQELLQARAQLSALESLVADAELDVATLAGELDAFDRLIQAVLSTRYAELDTLLARIRDHELRVARQAASDAVDAGAARRRVEAAERAASEAHQQAHRSAQEAKADEAKAPSEPFRPSKSLKSLFHKVALAVHPDLARDDDDRRRRTELMARANAAYAALDEAALEAILAGAAVLVSPDAGELREQLASVIVTIAHLETRLADLESQRKTLENSELHGLLLQSRIADSEGRDFVVELARELESEIAQATARWVELQQ